MMDAGFKGYISNEYTFWCGSCGEWDQIAARNKHEAIRTMKVGGWRNTRKQGWVCPKCLASKP